MRRTDADDPASNGHAYGRPQPRGAFLDAAKMVFTQPRNGELHALVMVDVDHFKRINDRYGHGYGDQMLARICDLLRSALRADDLVGRIGGDEFVLLLKNVVNRDALLVKINSLCTQVYENASDRLEISCNFGAATYPQDGADFDELYRKADTALYVAKRSGSQLYAYLHTGHGVNDAAV